MNQITQKTASLITKTGKKPMNSFLKALFFYTLLFSYWVFLFITNEGPGGVELEHLILMGIVHIVTVGIHALAIFKKNKAKAIKTISEL